MNDATIEENNTQNKCKFYSEEELIAYFLKGGYSISEIKNEGVELLAYSFGYIWDESQKKYMVL